MLSNRDGAGRVVEALHGKSATLPHPERGLDFAANSKTRYCAERLAQLGYPPYIPPRNDAKVLPRFVTNPGVRMRIPGCSKPARRIGVATKVSRYAVIPGILAEANPLQAHTYREIPGLDRSQAGR